MNLNILKISLCAMFFSALTGCDLNAPDDGSVSSAVYLTSSHVQNDLLIKKDIPSAERSISIRTANPAAEESYVTFDVDADKLADYNTIYGTEAVLFPAECYSIPESTSTIMKGDVYGSDVVVEFNNINELDNEKLYVLPVSVSDAGSLGVLESSRTTYFVAKGAAPINVVADVSKCHFPINWSESVKSEIRDIKVLTFEGLMRTRNDQWTWVNTVIGGYYASSFVIRMVYPNQIGVTFKEDGWAYSTWPTADQVTTIPQLPTYEWVHIAVVYDFELGSRKYYMDGVCVLEEQNDAFTANGTSLDILADAPHGWYIAYNYGFDSANRTLNADISEFRLWKTERTAEQISANMYELALDDHEGLFGYWKFNEGSGTKIKDYSGYGTDLTSIAIDGSGAEVEPTWLPVELGK